ncbi:hypothetical protein ABFX02_04G108600 [Erythranthe guttata]
MNSISNWLCTNSNKNLFVKIVHPGGHVELHDRPVLAADLLNRNPKCCVAHPTVFHHPHAAVLSPETTLVLGNKYYVVPLGTIRKLRLKHNNNNSNKNNSSVLGEKNHNRRNYSNIGKKNDEDDDELSDCNWLSSCGKKKNSNNGAKEKNGKNSDRCIISDESKMKRGRKMAGNNKEYSSRASSPPGRLSLASLDNWHPGLESINEEY